MIYICIPAHNEEQTVGVVLWKIRQVMAEFPRDYQLLVADDASTDKTSEVLTPYARVLPLTVVRTDQRRGYSASLEMLLREAVRRSEYPKRDVIITLQADFSQEPEELVPIIRMMEAGADIVVGESTLAPDTEWKIRWSRGIAAKLLGRKSVPAGVRDPFTGYRAYRVFTIRKAMDEREGGRLLQHDGWAANAELLAATAPHARRIETIDVTVRPHRLQRPSRLHPWPALKNVWAYARRAKPELETASVVELDEAVASGATSRRNDVASVRERMTERSDSHGNRSPHGDRQPHNARPERGRYERPTRDRQPANGDRQRSEPRSRAPRENADVKSTSQPQQSQRAPKEGRGRRNGNRKQTSAESSTVTPEVVLFDSAAQVPVSEAVVPDAAAEGDVTQAGAETKRRRRRGRRSRGGAKRAAAGTAADGASDAGDVQPADADAAVPSEMQSQSGDTGDNGAEAGDDVSAGDASPNGDGAPAKKRRRGRRGGRGRRRPNAAIDANASSDDGGPDDGSPADRGSDDRGSDEGTLEQHVPVAVEDHRVVVEPREHHEPAKAPMTGDDDHANT